ncbi:MAG: spermidine/putrescine ABC transporter substrate-binding protein [Candidatus Cloacimonetes bacterium]|nr:spermidine/putrescine ABC transporter substrate-binding protein [Candidatus Cloacimonadota bacterium]
MKKISILILLVAVLLVFSCQPSKKTLFVSNWSDYLDPDLKARFEKENNCVIRLSTYESNENMLTKILSSKQSYDVVFPSGDHVTIMQLKNLLEPLDKDKLNNYANLDPAILLKAQSFDPENKHAVPYFWGLTGLMYNKKYVPEDLIASKSWKILEDKFWNSKSKITMLDDAREVVGAALISAGYDPNDVSQPALSAAASILESWDANITQFDSDSYKNEVPDGTTWIAQAYNGDALQVLAENEGVSFFLPGEGASLWIDSVVILKSSKNKDLAYKFIDFLLDAENAKINAEYTSYPTPNLRAYELLDEEVKSNPLIYPDSAYLDKCYMLKFLGEDVKRIDAIFEQIKTN